MVVAMSLLVPKPLGLPFLPRVEEEATLASAFASAILLLSLEEGEAAFLLLLPLVVEEEEARVPPFPPLVEGDEKAKVSSLPSTMDIITAAMFPGSLL